MNVLLVASDNNRTSGAFLCLVELAKNLRDIFGVHVIVVIPKKGDGIDLLSKENIPYFYIKSYSWVIYKGWSIKSVSKYIFKRIAMMYNKKSISEIERIIERENIDIVHINTIFSYVGAVAALNENCKLIWHIRESLSKGFFSKILNEKSGYQLINQSDKIIAVSRMIANEYNSFLKQDKISIIHDGVTNKFYEKHEILKKEIFTIACIGGLILDKNQQELIESIKILVNNGITNIQVKFIGRGPLKQKLTDLVSQYKLNKNIEFLGARNDIEKILVNCDCVCSVSKSEAFGRTLIEGMLSGCIVIAAESKLSAAGEIIENKRNGLLYKSSDVEELAATIKWTMNTSNKLFVRKIAKEGQQFAKDFFSSNVNARKIYEIYEEVIRS